MPGPRKTDRVTRSTSVTSSGSHIIAQPIDLGLINQARIDLTLEIWEERESFRKVLAGHVRGFENSGYLTVSDYEGLTNIVRYNDKYTTRKRQALYVPPLNGTPADTPPPMSVTPDTPFDEGLDEEPPLSCEEQSEVPFPEEAPIPADPVIVAEDDSTDDNNDMVEEDCMVWTGTDIVVFNPPVTALYVAQGWGFTTSATVERFRLRFADFPKPINGSNRKTPIWWWSDIAVWTREHQADIDKARTRGQKQATTRAAKRTETSLVESQARIISQLQAEIAAMKESHP